MKRLLVVLLVLGLASTVFGASQWDKLEPLGTRAVSDLDSYLSVNNEALDRLLSTYRTGCYGYSSSNSAFYVSIGSVVCSNAAGTVRKFRTNTSATSVTWTNLDAGGEANSTVYFYYAIADTDATTFTITISTSSSVPTGVTYYKKLGAFYNNASGNIEIGGIIEMYSGFISALPPGYVLCDGTNGTPDLRDKFILGAGNLASTNAYRARTLAGTESTITSIQANANVCVEGGNVAAYSVDIMPPYYALAFVMRQGVE